MNDSNVLSCLVLFDKIPSNLQHVCHCCLDIVSNASSHQIKAAVEYNQNEINKLLVQLLTINFIANNEKTVQTSVEKIAGCPASDTQLKKYCNQKLLEISPIHGFSPKPYFLEYNVSDDIRMEILTYLQPIQLFKTITLLNKQFNKNVQTMHESTNSKYSKMFETRNYIFKSFLEVEEYCNNMKRKTTQRYKIVFVKIFETFLISSILYCFLKFVHKILKIQYFVCKILLLNKYIDRLINK